MTQRTSEQYYAELTAAVRDAFPDREYSGEIGPSTLIFADLGLASIDVVVLAEHLERRYARKLPFGPFLAELRTRGADDLSLGEVVEFLRKHVP